MEEYWDDTPNDDYSKIFFISSTSRSHGFFSGFAKGWNYGDSLFYLSCPDAVLTAVNSIDVKIYNANNNVIICDDKNVKWEVSTKLERDYFQNPRIFLAEIGIYLSIDPDYKKNETYKMEIYIKNIDEEGSYNNCLYFEQPAGKTDWVFKYVE